MQKKIYFFTWKRDGFSHFVPIIRELKRQNKVLFKIIADNMHLSNFFGKTIKEISKYTKNIQVKRLNIEDSVKNRIEKITQTTLEISKI